MTVGEEVQEMWDLFMPIAIVEHHQMIEPTLDKYDICKQLGTVWQEVQEKIQNNLM
jgi:hypothetical protein